MANKELIYMDDVRRAIAKVDPAMACFLDGLKRVDADRVFVAPCKMGEPIYIVITKIPKPGFPQFTFIKRSRLKEHNFFRVLREIGKTIFLTKEEAEAKKAQIEGDNICQED